MFRTFGLGVPNFCGDLLYYCNSQFYKEVFYGTQIPTTGRELLHAKLDALLDECDLIESNEQTLDTMELFFLNKGREFLKETFQEKLQERVKNVEASAEGKQCSDCKKKTEYKDKKTKNITSVHGHVALERCYRYCNCCNL